MAIGVKEDKNGNWKKMTQKEVQEELRKRNSKK